MPQASDTGSKRRTGLAPAAWLRWVTQRPDAIAGEIVAADCQGVSRESEVLAQADSRETGHFLVLNEIQLRDDARPSRRMDAHAASGFEHSVDCRAYRRVPRLVAVPRPDF
jgi:hypothetical protein